MGFFDFLKKEGVKKELITEIEISEVSEKIRKNLSEKIRKFENEIKILKDSVISDFRALEKIGDDLEKINFSEGSERINAMIKMIKINYVKNIRNSVKNVKDINEVDYENVKNFCSQSKNILSELKNIPPKNAYILSNYFREDMKRFVDKMKEIENGIDKIENYLKSDGVVLNFVKDVEIKTDKIISMKRKIEQLKNEIENIKKDIEIYEEKMEEKKDELKNILESDDYKNLDKIRGEIEEINNEKNELEINIKNELSAIKRPLKKFLHSKSDISVHDRKIIESFINSPLKTFMENLEFKKILEDVKKEVKNLGIKEADKKRVEKLDIENLFDKKIRYEKLLENFDQKRYIFSESSSKILQKKGLLESEIGYLKKEIDEKKNDLTTIENRIRNMESEILKEKSDLERLVFETIGEKFLIKL